MASLSSDNLSPVLAAFNESEPLSTAACPTRAISQLRGVERERNVEIAEPFALPLRLRRRVDVERVGLEIQEDTPARAVQRLREGHRAGEIRAIQRSFRLRSEKPTAEASRSPAVDASE